MKVFFIVGPTASGKSQFAIEWAERYGAVIVNADSLQFYQGLSIGSAAPSLSDMSRVPHYLFHCLKYPDQVSAGWFYRTIHDLLSTLKQEGIKNVLVVGGTGFYLEVLEKGLLPVGGENPELRRALEQRVQQGEGLRLYEELKKFDPDWALKIKPQDGYRIVRALETIQTTGTTLTRIHQDWEKNRPPFAYPLFKIGLTGSRSWLLERVTERTQGMLASGLLEEVRPFLTEARLNWSPLKSVGYREAVLFLQGQIGTEQELTEEIVKSTMLLIKKQKTWFKRDTSIKWIEPEKAQWIDWAFSQNYFPANLEN